MQSVLETHYGIRSTDEKGKVTVDRISEKKYEALVAEKVEGEPEPDVSAIQEFKRYMVETIEDFVNLVPDPQEQVNIINRTIGIKETDAMRDLFRKPGFQGQEGVYDLAPAIAEKSAGRKAASPLEATLRSAGKLSGEDIARLLVLLQERLQATS